MNFTTGKKWPHLAPIREFWTKIQDLGTEKAIFSDNKTSPKIAKLPFLNFSQGYFLTKIRT